MAGEENNYNELKLKTLAIFDEVLDDGGATSKNIAKTLDRDHPAISKALSRYNRQDILSREKDVVREEKDGRLKAKTQYLYSITEKGRERKEYLEEKIPEGWREEVPELKSR